MGRRPRLNRSKVVDAAVALVDRDGPEALTVAALADTVGVKPPSLYNHIDGLGALQAAVALRALAELGAKVERAAVGRSGPRALRAVALAYRDFALARPGLYALTQRSYEDAGADLQAAGRDVVEVLLAILEGYDLEGDDAVHAARCVRSALHGFVLLESGGGFGLALPVAESFERLLTLLDHGLRADPAG